MYSTFFTSSNIIYVLVLNLEAAAINFLHYNFQIKSVSRYAGSGMVNSIILDLWPSREMT